MLQTAIAFEAGPRLAPDQEGRLMVRHIPRLPKNFRANTAYTQGRGGGTNGEYITLASSLLRSGKKPKEVEKNETHTGLDADICSGASRGSRRVGGSARSEERRGGKE